MKRFIWLYLITVLFFASAIKAQDDDNLSVINKLLLQSVSKIDSVYKSKHNAGVKIFVPEKLKQLEPNLISAFKSNGYSVNPQNEKSGLVNYTLIDAGVIYKNSFMDGIFGNVIVEREVKLNGAFFLESSDGVEAPVYFNLSNIDSVRANDVNNLENKSIPFTQGEIPPAPMLSNLIEPIIIVGTLITTVILLFTVRSK